VNFKNVPSYWCHLRQERTDASDNFMGQQPKAPKINSAAVPVSKEAIIKAANLKKK